MQWRPWVLTLLAGCHAASPLPESQEPVVVVQVTEPRAVTAPAPPTPEPAAAVAVAPVLSIGGVRPGMSVEQFRQVIGKEGRSEEYDAVKDQWVNAGYDTDRQIEFLVGFDTVLTYNAGLAPTALPIWTVFVRSGVIALIKLTMYVPGTAPVQEAGFPPSCFLTRDPKGIEETFGTGYVYDDDQAHSQVTYHFLERGISVLAKDGKIAVMNVYEPIRGARVAAVKQALRGTARDDEP
jgi:hypothetical protein